MRNKEDPYAKYAVKDNAMNANTANAQSMEDPYAKYAQKQSQPEEQDQAEGIFNPKVREYLAKGGNPYIDKLRHMQDQSLKEYSKGFYPSAYESLANQSTALNNLLGTKLPYYHDLKKPQSEAEAEGQRVGPIAMEMLPAAAGSGAASLIAKAPQEAGLLAKFLSSSGRLGLGAGGGAAAGAATSENRAQGALSGAEQGAGAVLIPGTASWLENRFGIKPVEKAAQALQESIQQEAQRKAALEKAQYEAKGAGYPMKHQEYPTKIEHIQEAIQNAVDELQGLPKEDYSENVLHPAHTQLTPIAQEQYQHALQQTQAALRHGEPVDEQLGTLMAEHFEGPIVNGRRQGGLKGELANEFNAIDQSMPETLIRTTRPSEHEIEAEVNKYISDVGNPTARQAIREEVTRYLTEANGEPISVRDAYRRYRHLTMEITEDGAALAQEKLKTEDYYRRLGEIEGKRAEINHLENLIREHAPASSFERLQAVKNRWATEYAPIRASAIFREARKHNRISAQDLMHALRGDEPGNVILRNWIHSNPQASILTAGMHYGEHPERLMNLNRTQQAYINEQTTPDLMRYIQNQIEAHQGIQRAQAQQQHFSEQHELAAQEAKQHAAQRQRAEVIQEKELPKLLKKRADLERLQEKIRMELEAHNLSKEEVEARKTHLKKLEERSKQIKQQMRSMRAIVGSAFAYNIYHRKH